MSIYLVTGGCGFIGSHLCDALLGQGHRVRVLDNLSTGKRTNLDPRAQLTAGDITCAKTVRRAMEGVDGCFHLAAVASVERSISDWASTNSVNVTGTVNVFDAARDVGGGKTIPVVYASSAAIYGDNSTLPLSELETPSPLSAYGVDKVACELHGRVATLLHGIPTVGFRLFNVYGPRQDPSSVYSGVISIFAECMLKGRPITIYGDGEQTRDFVHVKDAVGFLLAGMKDGIGTPEVLNVCTGHAISINQLAQTIADIAEQPPEIQNAPPRSGDIRFSCGDPSKARSVLGVEAMTPLDEGLRDTLGYIENSTK